MTTRELEKLRYPIGKFKPQRLYKPLELTVFIKKLELLPAKLAALVSPLSAEQLAVPYRPDGWTVQQVVHHVADSHLNAFIRVKLALTEDKPTIKPYDENKWVQLADTLHEDIQTSLDLLSAVHRRLDTLLKHLNTTDWQREYYHPELQRHVNLTEVVAMYHWHGEHHYEHIRQLALRSEWITA